MKQSLEVLQLIDIVYVTKEEELSLHNLMQFYIYEFSQYIPAITLEQNGSYKRFELKHFWSSPNHHPFFIKRENELIGFALVKSSNVTEPNSILEFFIIRKYSGLGYGKAAAHILFSKFPGKWFVTQIEKNEPAKAFWRNTISTFTSGQFTERLDENNRSIQEFVTPLLP